MPPKKKDKKHKHRVIVQDDGASAASAGPVLLPTEEFIEFIESLNPGDHLRIVIPLHREGEDASEADELWDSLVGRIAARQFDVKGGRRYVVSTQLQVLKEVSEQEDDLQFPKDVVLYVVGHGTIGRISGITKEELVEQLIPFFRKFPDIRDLKVATCFSSDRVCVEEVEDPRILERLRTAGLGVSVAFGMSRGFLAAAVQGVRVHAYHGAHYEDKSRVGRGEKERHSFVELGKEVFRASEARVTVRDGALISEPSHPKARGIAIGSFIAINRETGNNDTFNTTYLEEPGNPEV